MKEQIIKRDGDKCKICGSQSKLTIDHIIPLSEGGTNSLNNVQLLCCDCNQRKGAMYKLPFIKHIRAIWTLRDYCQKWKNEVSTMQGSTAKLVPMKIAESESRIKQELQSVFDKKIQSLVDVIKYQDEKLKALQEYLKVEYFPPVTNTTITPAHFIKVKNPSPELGR